VISRLFNISTKLGVHVILHTRNEGIAWALNRGSEWAASQGFRWILTLDQDTTVEPDIVDSLVDVFCRYPFPQYLAVIGSNYTDKITGKVKLNLTPFTDSPSIDSVSVLTSGSLVSLSVLRAIGGFREDFFIDCVDHEYCLRARSHGFRVVISSKPVMKQHGIGRLTEHQVLWKRVGTSNHDPVRQYFLSRNSVILAKEYLSLEPRWILRYWWLWLKSIVCSVFLKTPAFRK
jgi:rhamnosyltransferase